MKNILSLILVLMTVFSFAQGVEELGWEIKGEQGLTLNQNAFSNWSSGGVNSTGLIASVDYQFNNKKEKTYWDNQIKLAYGLQATQGDKRKKTEDKIFLSTTYGRQIKNDWYATAFATLETQFDNGYDYDDFPDYVSGDRSSSFMAPGYLVAGLGFEYKPNDKFKLSLSPLASKVTLVLDKGLQYQDNFGLKADGDWGLYELGASVGVSHEFEAFKNVTVINKLTLFSNYLSHPERIDMDYSLDVKMKVNEVLSANFGLAMKYNHDELKKLQVKQLFGAGLVYKFEK